MSFLRVGAAAGAALLLMGCSSGADDSATDPATPAPTATSSAPAAQAPSRGLPEGVAGNPAGTAGAGLSPDGKLWIVTYGSSSNPLAVTEVSAEGQTVTVGLAPDDRPATMDLVPTTSTIAVPEGVDASQPITVILENLGSLEIDTEPGSMSWLPAQ